MKSLPIRIVPFSLAVVGTLVLTTPMLNARAAMDHAEHSGHEQMQQMDHSQHGSHDQQSAQMDHASHGTMNEHADHGAHGEHAAHAAMMQSKGKYQITSASYALPDVKLVDMTNKEITLPAIFDTDKPMLVNFIFTTCTTICPIMSATFAQAQDLLGPELENVQMVSISIDPEQDTPEKLMEYAYKFQAAPVWNFYTGKMDDVIAALKAFDAYRGDKMNHEPITLLRKNKDSSWVRMEGLASAKDLVAEYRKVVAN